MDDSPDPPKPTTAVVPPPVDPIAMKILLLRIAKYREQLAALLTFARRGAKEHSTYESQAFLRGVQTFLDEER